jgi:hypothetical protein
MTRTGDRRNELNDSGESNHNLNRICQLANRYPDGVPLVRIEENNGATTVSKNFRLEKPMHSSH